MVRKELEDLLVVPQEHHDFVNREGVIVRDGSNHDFAVFKVLKIEVRIRYLLTFFFPLMMSRTNIQVMYLGSGRYMSTSVRMNLTISFFDLNFDLREARVIYSIFLIFKN